MLWQLCQGLQNLKVFQVTPNFKLKKWIRFPFARLTRGAGGGEGKSSQAVEFHTSLVFNLYRVFCAKNLNHTEYWRVFWQDLVQSEHPPKGQLLLLMPWPRLWVLWLLSQLHLMQQQLSSKVLFNSAQQPQLLAQHLLHLQLPVIVMCRRLLFLHFHEQ